MTDLLPCPFCGGEAHFAPLVWTEGFYTVGCPSCRVWTRTTIDRTGRHGTPAELHAVWNRRAPKQAASDGGDAYKLARCIMTLCGCAPASPSLEPGACEITDKIVAMLSASVPEQEGASEVKGLASSRANTPLPSPDAGWRDALEKAYAVLGAAHSRIHCLLRTSDTELAKRIEQMRAEIERALRPLPAPPVGDP